MTDRTMLIVARLAPGAGPRVAGLFAESDRTELPRVLGVRRRRLFEYQGLYFHYAEFDRDPAEAMRIARERPDFAALSAALADHVQPFDPRTWRGPADAMAAQFYGWAPGRNGAGS